ncbi:MULTISPECIES: MBG domain-containing protein [Niastella]|uniref:Gliding motility-associated C-terminal domain-containing protein n=1 Tax=Niastella soli TaxID=2821487 RepID=A0ABS3YYB8_9BACT|nr:MBG domain-containing protein [Niastella soli]MBO9202824.1 gliding motility-associated C-terminal domain-containing protein [Niastella soli]
MNRNLRFFYPIGRNTGWLKSVFILLLLPWCYAGIAQDAVVSDPVAPQSEGMKAIEANFLNFPVTEKIPAAIWGKVNPGLTYHVNAVYRTFGNDPVKYAEVVKKRTAYESYYIDPAHPAQFTKRKGFDPINFQRNGEWIPVDATLKPVGNNIYEATDQWDPVGINITAKESYIITATGKVQFNNWSLYGVTGNNKTLLATADWSQYTIGSDGIRITNIFPGMDAEMRVSRGGVKTSFIIHRLNFTKYQELYFEDAFKGLQNKGLYFDNSNTESSSTETAYADVSGSPKAIKITPAFGYMKSAPSVVTKFPFHVSGNKLSVAVPADFIKNGLTTGDVVIDPLVQSSNSIAAATAGSMYNASCGWANSCDYTIAVTPPANATITGIATSEYIVATAPCGIENFAWKIIMGTCQSPGVGLVRRYSASGPGAAWAGYINETSLLPCAPAPSCTPAPINVTFKLYRGCVGPVGCDNTCIGLVQPLEAVISGHTAELSTITATTVLQCNGQDITFNTSGINGVPPFSTIDWSYDPSGIPSLGTGPSITTGAALTPGNYTIHARATDACGTLAQTNLPFVIKPLPVITLAAGETICNGGITNITPSSSEPGTTYTWTVVQTGVTGASNGSGTAITQTLSNSGTTTGTAVYTITPTANGCDGTPVIYTVTVNPVPAVLYVDGSTGNDNNCGSTWTDAFKTFSRALDVARQSTIVDSILVAKGTYYPTGDQTATNRDSSFLILRGKFKIYGGYPNGGGVRDIVNNPTILSGDIGTLNDSIDNSYHVMVITGNIPATSDSIVVDGFTFTKGTANGSGLFNYANTGIFLYQGHGAGIYMQANATGPKTALRNLTFTDGTAAILGGAMELVAASPLIQNCTFSNNRTLTYGGALANDHKASPYVTGCSFTGNISNNAGGAIFSQDPDSGPTFDNCSFTGNKATTSSSSTYGGAMFNRNAATVNITNCTFTGNQANSTGFTYGGVIYSIGSSTTNITKSIFTTNQATGGGGAIAIDGNSITNISYSSFDGNISRNLAGDVGSGGALQTMTGGGTFNINNSVLVNNSAAGTNDDGGGAIMAYSGTFNCRSVTLSGNITASSIKPNAAGISVVAGATVNFFNSISWGNPANQVHNLGTINYDHSLVKGSAAALPNLDLDPQFVNAGNPSGPDGQWGTADDGLQLTPCSPAADMGNNSLLAGIPTDEAGNGRIFGPLVDMGAYELQAPLTPMNFTNVVKTYGDADAPVPNITNCSGLPVTFSITNTALATIVSGNLHILKAGTTTITAHTVNGVPDVTVNLTINPKPITIGLTSTAVSKVYDGNTNATVSAANLQFAAGDVVGTDDVTITLSSPLASYDTKDAGTGKTVSVPLANISLTGTTAGNYIISNTTDISAPIGIITPLAIIITADTKTKVYSNVDPAFTYTNTPALIAGDAFTGSLNRTPGENVGTYTINQGSLALSSNYTITYNANDLTITPLAITITADTKTKVYGNADPALTYTYTPALVTGDAFTGSLSRAAGENVGTYTINQGSLALSSNYTITYNANDLAITPLAIAITADTKTKVYGNADPALTYIYTPALIGSDAFSGSLTRTAGENIGNYTINQGSLVLSSNYTTTFTNNNLLITPRPVTVTATGQSKTYGDADPALTYTFAPALAFSDVFTGSLSRASGENVGIYAIGQNTLTLGNNYQLTYVPADLVILKAVLTATAGNKTICANETLYSSEVPVSYSGFKFSDNKAVIRREPTTIIPAYSSAGTYSLIPIGGSADNYTFAYAYGQLTVLPVPLGAIAQIPIGPGVVNTPNVNSGVQLNAPADAGYNYSWSTGETTQSILTRTSGAYSVRVTNSQGCSTKFYSDVKQLNVIIPNIFSPNGDNLHDRWVIENLENYPGNIVLIYNRYGQVVYKMSNFTSWDGKVNGTDMPVGTYYYIIDLRNGQKPLTGYIDIIR